MKIIPGVYESLISQAIEEKLNELSDSLYYVKKEDIVAKRQQNKSPLRFLAKMLLKIHELWIRR